MPETYDSVWKCYSVDTDDGTNGDIIYERVSSSDIVNEESKEKKE